VVAVASTIAGTATVTSNTPDPNAENNKATVTTRVCTLLIGSICV
jgi:hypothetical protein